MLLGISRQGFRYLLQRFGLLTLFGVCCFVGAGEWDWRRGWAALGVCFFAESVANGVLAYLAPQTLNERGTRHDGIKQFDIVFAIIYLVLSFSLAAVAGIDCVRFGWSSMSWSTFYAGGALMVLTTFVGTWSMVENEHFEQFVRVQSDREHRVVTTGPYRLVRHPGYLAAVLGTIAGPLLFGSAWSFVPAMLMVFLFVWRTAREDLTLQQELEGYAEYTRQTPYRILPLVW